MGQAQPAIEPKPRDYGRLPLGIPATLETLHGRKHVRLIDLSQGGALVALPQDIPVRDCVLTWLGFEAFCAVAWSKGRLMGLKFDEDLPVAAIVTTRSHAPDIIAGEIASVEDAARAWVDGRVSFGVDR